MLYTNSFNSNPDTINFRRINNNRNVKFDELQKKKSFSPQEIRNRGRQKQETIFFSDDFLKNELRKDKEREINREKQDRLREPIDEYLKAEELEKQAEIRNRGRQKQEEILLSDEVMQNELEKERQRDINRAKQERVRFELDEEIRTIEARNEYEEKLKDYYNREKQRKLMLENIPDTDISQIGFVPYPYINPLCPEKGTVKEYENIPGASIYLPYNYEKLVDEGYKFNIVIAYHGGGCPTNDLTDRIFPERIFKYSKFPNRKEYSPHDIWDNMIYYNLTNPFIVISVPYKCEKGVIKGDEGRKLKEEYLPTIAKDFSTYSEGSDIESLTAAKDHFLVAGFSDGCHTIYNSILEDASDCVGNYILTSGGSPGMTESLMRIYEEGKEVSYIYGVVGGGGDDVVSHRTSYDRAVEVFGGPDKVKGEYQVIGNLGHSNDTLVAGLFLDIPKIWPNSGNAYILNNDNGIITSSYDYSKP